MKHIAELITQPSPASTAPQQPSLSQKAAAKLWRIMTEMYGHKWLSAYGESDNGTWAKGLAGLTAQQLATGVRACFERGDAWPPTLPEFRALCLQRDDREHAGMYRRFKALPAPKSSKETAKRCIGELREKVAAAQGPKPRLARKVDTHLNDVEFEYYQQHGRFPDDAERAAIVEESA